jgi:hypothetical protein
MSLRVFTGILPGQLTSSQIALFDAIHQTEEDLRRGGWLGSEEVSRMVGLIERCVSQRQRRAFVTLDNASALACCHNFREDLQRLEGCAEEAGQKFDGIPLFWNIWEMVATPAPN